jgi:hypothetical protein
MRGCARKGASAATPGVTRRGSLPQQDEYSYPSRRRAAARPGQRAARPTPCAYRSRPESPCFQAGDAWPSHCRILVRVREEIPVWPLERSLPRRSILPLGRAGPSGANVVGRRTRRLSISRMHAGECQQAQKTEYRAEPTTGNACPLKAKCTPSNHGRQVHRHFAESYLEGERAYHQAPAQGVGRAALCGSERMAWTPALPVAASLARQLRGAPDCRGPEPQAAAQ